SISRERSRGVARSFVAPPPAVNRRRPHPTGLGWHMVHASRPPHRHLRKPGGTAPGPDPSRAPGPPRLTPPPAGTGVHSNPHMPTAAIVIFRACPRPVASLRNWWAAPGPVLRPARRPLTGQGPRAHERLQQKALTQPPVVRPRGQAGLLLPQLAPGPGPAARHVRRPPGDRPLQYLVGTDALQQPLPRAGRARQARRVRGRRLPAGVPGDVA